MKKAAEQSAAFSLGRILGIDECFSQRLM